MGRTSALRSPMVARVRRFNRTMTQRVGALSDRYLARGRTLGASRVLWEIGREGCEVRALRSRLELDSAQLSRLLRGLEEEGLVASRPSPADRRIRFVTLTAAGLRERTLLDARSDELARSILGPLDDSQRAELASAMRSVERLITASLVDVRLADPAGPDAQGCLRAYFAELDRRSDTGFDPTMSTPAEPHELSPPAGAFLEARLRGEPIGCGGIKHLGNDVSEIKRMWVAESARGLGIGRRLLDDLEALARERGAAIVRLDA